MAPGDEYDSYGDAKSDAVDDVYDRTAQDATSGRQAALAWQELNLQDTPYLDGSGTNWVIAQQSGSWTAVYGREYATYVYKFKNSSGDFKWTYSDPSRFIGAMPSVQRFKNDQYGVTTVLTKSEIDSKGYADSGISVDDACEVKAIIHTHSMTIVGIDNPDRSISADDEIYANDVGFRIIAVKPDKVLEEYAP